MEKVKIKRNEKKEEKVKEGMKRTSLISMNFPYAVSILVIKLQYVSAYWSYSHGKQSNYASNIDHKIYLLLILIKFNLTMKYKRKIN